MNCGIFVVGRAVWRSFDSTPHTKLMSNLDQNYQGPWQVQYYAQYNATVLLSRLKETFFHHEDSQEDEQVAERGCAVSSFGDLQAQTG